MNRVRTRAPGKLFLLGEYAVLDGAPAIIAAVDRYVEVTVERRRAPRVVIASDHSSERLEFAAGQAPVDCGFYRLASTAYRVCAESFPSLSACGLEIHIASAAGFADGSKLGFGSSAAVTAAIVAALSAVATDSREISKRKLFAIALDAHRRSQQGIGSGADVAASVFGAIVLFRPRTSGLPEVAVIAPPLDLNLLVAWTGKPASTVNLVQQYLALNNGNRAAREQFVAQSKSAAEQFMAALTAGEICLEAIDASAQAMEKLASQTGLPIFTDALHRLLAAARMHGAAAKVSGAGGGDCGIAILCDVAARASIHAAWRAAELEPVEVAISQQGVTVEPA